MENPEHDEPKNDTEPDAELEPNSILTSLDKLGRKYESITQEFIRLRAIEQAATDHRKAHEVFVLQMQDFTVKQMDVEAFMMVSQTLTDTRTDLFDLLPTE